MSAAVRKVTEQVEAVGKAAEVIHAVADLLTVFRELAVIEPSTMFGQTVSQHRQHVEKFDKLLRGLCFGGRQVEGAAGDVGFGREAVATIREAHVRLRVLRTLSAVLAGETNALASETPEVRNQVEKALAERAEANGRLWTREERAAFEEGPRPFSAAFEARLNGS
jgi:hypothetical protein